ncbi:MAG: 2-C-methyl-D-erythritol 4-phosphate cytidylyltransferase [Actinomycetota bacterium]
MIAAAGSGERLGAGGPKAFVELAGKPLLDWSLEAFRAASSVGPIIIAAPPGEQERIQAEGVEVVAGGSTRSESVAAAMELVGEEVVVVHDAARPLVTAELVDAVVADLLDDPDAGAVVAAAPVTDTIKQVARGMEVDRTLDRSSLWAAQTPQAFRAEQLREALASTALLAQATDDAMLVERIGGRVLLHEAPAENLKVTTPLDLRIAELLLSQ